MSNDSRLFLGRLPHDVDERDVEKFFEKRDFKARNISLKKGYGFVDMESPRYAEDAMRELNGRELLGTRVVIEMSKPKRGYDDYDRGGRSGRYDDRGGRRDFGGGRGRSGPYSTKYRMIIEGLSTRCDWKDLKDWFRGATYTDAHKKREGEGIAHFETYEDLKRAIDEYDGKEMNGKRLRLIDETDERDRHRQRSPRRSRSPRRNRSRSRSPYRKRSRSPSRDSHSRSRSPRRESRSRSPTIRSRSRSGSH